jgi:hypothetical protein
MLMDGRLLTLASLLVSAAGCTAQIVPNFRVRTIPVLGTAPAIFGMAAASFMLCQLAGSPFDGEPIIQLTAQQYDRALIRLQQREEEVFGNSEGLPVDRDDVSKQKLWSTQLERESLTYVKYMALHACL